MKIIERILKLKIKNQYINYIDLFVIFLFLIFLIYFIAFFGIRQKFSDEFLLIIHTSILTSLIMIYIFIENESKHISQLSILFSVIGLPSIFIIENFSNTSGDIIHTQINYSFFAFYRAIYYYFLIKTINIYFNNKNGDFFTAIYFAFVLYNLAIVFLTKSQISSIEFNKSLILINHYISYLLKPLPYIIVCFLIIKNKHKLNYFNIIFVVFSILCFLSVILSIYFYKIIRPYFHLIMDINSVIFILYIEFMLIGRVLNDKKDSESIKNRYIKNFTEKTHDLSLAIKAVRDKIDEKDSYKVEKALEIIKDVNKKISEFDIVKYTEVDILKFIDLTTNQYFDSHETNIELDTKKIKKNTRILLDRDKIDTIINNLIINAIEYMKSKDIELYIKISVYFKAKKFLFLKKEYICFTVENEGEIISSTGKKIFNDGFSTKQSDSYNSGIGLYHSKRLAEKMKGNLTYVSINNKVTFYLNVPLLKK